MNTRTRKILALSASVFNGDKNESYETNLNDTISSNTSSIFKDHSSLNKSNCDEMNNSNIEMNTVTPGNSSDITSLQIVQKTINESATKDLTLTTNCDTISEVRISRNNDDESQNSKYISDSVDEGQTEDITKNNQESTSLEVDSAPTDVNTKLLKLNISNKGVKRHFCKYCKTMQTKFARHLENKHSDENEVGLFSSLPKKSSERLNIISNIRKTGDSLYNSHANYNKGDLIVVRRPQATKNRGPDHYIPCGHCNAMYSVLSLRAHYKNCNKMKKINQKNVFTISRIKGGRGVRKYWTFEEKQKIMELFGKNLKNRKLPSLAMCKTAIAENNVLKDRTPEMIKAYLHNNMKKCNV